MRSIISSHEAHPPQQFHSSSIFNFVTSPPMSSYSADQKAGQGMDATSAFYKTDGVALPSTARRNPTKRARGVWFLVLALGALGLFHLHGLKSEASVPQDPTACGSLPDDPEFVWDKVRLDVLG
jgi:hypothetical protein